MEFFSLQSTKVHKQYIGVVVVLLHPNVEIEAGFRHPGKYQVGPLKNHKTQFIFCPL